MKNHQADDLSKNQSDLGSPAVKCKNCGSFLNGPFCSQCGQHAKEHHLSFGRFVKEFAGDVFSFDSRIFKTMHLLIFHPGELTRLYLKGKRVSHIPPMRLYFFVSFVYFLVLAVLAPFTDVVKSQKSKQADGEGSLSILNSEGAVSIVGNPGASSDAKAGQNSQDQDRLKDDSHNISFDWSSSAEPPVDLQKRTIENPSSKEDSGTEQIKVPENQASVQSAHELSPFEKKMISVLDKKDFLNDLITRHFAKVFFLLVPLFAFFLKLLFRKGSFFYIEYLVFSLYFHGFAFFVLTLGLFVEYFAKRTLPSMVEIVSLPVWIWILIHLFKSLRLNFGGGWWKTAFKLFLVWICYFFVFSFSILAALLGYIWLFV